MTRMSAVRRCFASAALVAGLMLTGCSATQRMATAVPGQYAQSFERDVVEHVEGRYLLYLPQGYGEAGKEWPLVLFLHGAAKRGTDLDLVKMHGPPKLVDEGQEFPFIIVSPQCPTGAWWDTTVLIGLLDEITQSYAVDEDRVYVTGLSMGGFGTWALTARIPERIAAAAPICGGGHALAACRLEDVPIWAFHGDADTVVPLSRSSEMVEAVRKCGGNARLTIYPGVGHNAWTETYDNPALYEWLLQHRLSDRK